MTAAGTVASPRAKADIEDGVLQAEGPGSDMQVDSLFLAAGRALSDAEDWNNCV